MKILIYYHHGLGDCILLTPQLRYFHNKYDTKPDLLCRNSVISTKLFNNCPYVGKLIEIDNPWDFVFHEQLCVNHTIFSNLSTDYSCSYFVDHKHLNRSWSKVFSNSLSCRIFAPIDIQPEIFISNHAKKIATQYIHDKFPNGFIFKHTTIPLHPIHSWISDDWINENLPGLPVFDVAGIDTSSDIFSDINVTFYILSKADYVVLSSSVMAHAADAMKKPIDVLNYGKPDYYNLPVNKNIVRSLRVDGDFVDVEHAYSSLKYPKRIRLGNVLYDKAVKNINFLKHVSKNKLRRGLQ